MPRRELLLLAEMIAAAEQAQDLVGGRSLDDLSTDRQRRDALLWNFTVLGEASRQLPSTFTTEHPEVDWARPGRLRNRIVHGYWSIDLEVLHTTAVDDLPRYVSQLRAIRDHRHQ